VPNTLLFLTNYTLVVSTVKAFFKNPIGFLKAVKHSKKNKRTYGIKQNALTDPFINEEKLNIVFLPEFLQPFRKSLGERFFFAIPIIGENNYEDKEIRYAADKPLVYISFGNMSGDCSNETKNIINILLKYDVNILLSTCDGADIDVLENDKLKIRKFVNQEKVLKHASLFINHGGIHSVYEAIWYKVPQICIPNQTEQEANARIVKRLKCGHYVKKTDIKKLDNAVCRTLNNKAYLNVERLSVKMRNDAQMSEVIGRINQYLYEE
jgi:MGT family glycosyltransferase